MVATRHDDLPVTAEACDVLIVGAGPAGSSLAASLAAAGRSVTLAEAVRHPRPKACAEYASPRIVEELDRLGPAATAWRADAIAVRGMRVIRGDDAVDVRYADDRGPRPAWGLDRTRFDALLAANAEENGARLLDRTSFDGAERADNGWSVTVRHNGTPREIRARWLIGADGARSRVAHRLGVERDVRMPRRLGLVAHYESDPDLDDHGEMHIGPRHYVGLAPLAGGRLNVGMALPADGRGPAEARFAEAIEALPAVAARLSGRRRLTPIRGASPIGHRVARAAGPGWMLIGDAAGFVDPFTGEGIYRALRSARAATEALNAGDDGAAERYLSARRAAFAAKDALTWTIQALLAARPVMGYALRRLGDRPELAARLGSALGDCRPASDALSPIFLASVLRP
jgi:geranylgeranyl reductase family protein